MQQLANIEFFNYEGEVWYHLADGTMDRLLEQNTTVVDAVLHQIEEFYPGAFAALAGEYSRCKPNLPMYRYRIVKRFVRCNFGNIDNVQDIDSTGTWHLECVPCPLRGECRLENIVCRPTFNHKISDAEFRVLRLWTWATTKMRSPTRSIFLYTPSTTTSKTPSCASASTRKQNFSNMQRA